MAIDDELAKSESAKDIAQEAEKSAQAIITHAQVLGLIYWFLPPWAAPIAAGLGEGLNQLSNRRIYKRLNEMREAMHSRLEEVESSKVDKEWFVSEEFQTMLFEAARQVTATADQKKIGMLGNALANGGITDFRNESRKELFLQLIRDLTPQHITVLRRLLPDTRRPAETRWATRPTWIGEEQDMAVLQMLTASGLLSEVFTKPHIPPLRFSAYEPPSVNQATQALADLMKSLQVTPKRMFRLSEFGKDFLDFISFSSIPE